MAMTASYDTQRSTSVRRRVRRRPSEVKRKLLGKRINRGFHRLGLVMGLILTFIVFLTAFSVVDAVFAQVVLAGAALGIAVYCLLRAFGWIVLGFPE